MASIKGHKSTEMGLHEEVLTGRTQQVFFNPEESENFFYHDAYDVCLLYTSPSPRDGLLSRMPSSA